MSATMIAWALVGYQATIVSGTGNGQYCVIRANTATAISCSAGWVTNYYQLAIVNPDSTSKFVAEPNWSAHPATSGTATFTPFNFNVIGNCNGCAAASDVQLNDVVAEGGQLRVSGPFSKIKHLIVSWADWNSAGFILEDSLNFAELDDILVDKPDQVINVGGTAKRIAWDFAATAVGTPSTREWPFRIGERCRFAGATGRTGWAFSE
jgi:hypothetical protein